MKNDYAIYIPSRGRVTRQFTLAQLPLELRKITYLVVDEPEYNTYKAAHFTKCKAVLKSGGKGIAKVREFIANHCTKPKLIMLDDDLRFYARIEGSTKLRKLEVHEYITMFDEVSNWLDIVPHAAISAREGNNRIKEPYRYAARALRCLAFRTAEYKKIASVGRITVMEDFDSALRLMRQGWANVVLFNYAQNQDGGSNRAGGCSSYRTMAIQGLAAQTLARLHAPYVKVVTKQTRSAWQGQERQDVTVYWRKAWLSGLPPELA